MIGQILRAGWTFLERMFKRMFEFFSTLFGHLFQTLFHFLKILLRPLFIVVALLLYLVYKIAELAITLISVFLALGKLLLAFIKGIFVTLTGFTYTPSTPSNGQWTSIFNNVVGSLGPYQLDKIAYILLFCIWITTAFAAIRIIGSIRNGGE
ncbi:hypothetical protein [Paenibacillus durus]|uniref:hypothetical protein n=1 Tax=Paenibacillus durus TaxID=44251 RepID=UPI000694EFC4|nr:hypothetical protein [Paenibacillus durus]